MMELFPSRPQHDSFVFPTPKTASIQEQDRSKRNGMILTPSLVDVALYLYSSTEKSSSSSSLNIQRPRARLQARTRSNSTPAQAIVASYRARQKILEAREKTRARIEGDTNVDVEQEKEATTLDVEDSAPEVPPKDMLVILNMNLNSQDDSFGTSSDLPPTPAAGSSSMADSGRVVEDASSQEPAQTVASEPKVRFRESRMEELDEARQEATQVAVRAGGIDSQIPCARPGCHDVLPNLNALTYHLHAHDLRTDCSDTEYVCLSCEGDFSSRSDLDERRRGCEYHPRPSSPPPSQTGHAFCRALAKLVCIY